jgi:hypothetical protein
MFNAKKVFCVYFLSVFISCIALPHENPSEVFTELFDKYKTTEFKTVVLSQSSEGSGMFIFDTNKKISDDVFCLVELLSTLGQTQYFVYKKYSENIWYFHKKVYIYERPMELENAEIHKWFTLCFQ